MNGKTRTRRARPTADRVATMLEAGALPVADLATLAIREGQRPRPVYGAHKWFARRLGSAFRSLLVASVLPADGDFWGAFEDGMDLTGTVILDPFVGGGTSIVEAQRLGATCFGTDVDPVAVSISGFQSRMHGMPDLGPALSRLTDEVGTRMAPFHSRPDGRTVLHHFWVQVIGCRCCGHRFDAHPHFMLANEVDKTDKHVFCRHCGAVHSLPRNEEELDCEECGRRTELSKGNVIYGTAVCPACGETERLIDVSARIGRPPEFRPFATESIPLERGKRVVPMSGRNFMRADDHDLACFEGASAALHDLLASGGHKLPDRLIPSEDRSDDRLCRYGYRHYADLFNARQRLHLLLLGDAIRRMDAGIGQEALSIAFSDHLKSLNLMCGYAFGYRRLSPLFALRAFRHIPRPIELNPWIAVTGRGGFPNAVRQVERAAAWSRAPKEYRLSGGFAPAKFEIKGPADVRLSSAADLEHVADGTVDLVLTDPPYFDNIAYSELADFFLPWQRMLGLVDAPDIPGLPPEQLAAASRSEEDGAIFRRRLAACFLRVSDKMKAHGLAVFTYQHRTARGWQMLAEALAPCPLRVVTVFPMPGDVGASLHRHEDSICWDAVLVCRKTAKASPGALPGKVEPREAARVVARWRSELSIQKSAPFRAADRDNLWRAALVASALSAAPHAGRTDLAAALGLPWDESLAGEPTVATRAGSPVSGPASVS